MDPKPKARPSASSSSASGSVAQASGVISAAIAASLPKSVASQSTSHYAAAADVVLRIPTLLVPFALVLTVILLVLRLRPTCHRLASSIAQGKDNGQVLPYKRHFFFICGASTRVVYHNKLGYCSLECIKALIIDSDNQAKISEVTKNGSLTKDGLVLTPEGWALPTGCNLRCILRLHGGMNDAQRHKLWSTCAQQLTITYIRFPFAACVQKYI